MPRLLAPPREGGPLLKPRRRDRLLMESDGGDPDDVLELFGVDGDSDECEGMKVRRTRV